MCFCGFSVTHSHHRNIFHFLNILATLISFCSSSTAFETNCQGNTKNWNALQKRWILLHTCFPYNNHLIIKGCFNTPLEHTFGTPKPLPTGYEGIPFIVGWGGCLRCALLVLCNFFGNSCLSQLAKTIILSAANRKVQRPLVLRGRGCGCSASSRWSPVDKF